MMNRMPLLTPRKRFSQNFLLDSAVIGQICDSLGLRSDEQWLEIGPGYGALTKHLLPAVKTFSVVELDRDLIPQLKQECALLGELIVYQADALRFDFNEILKGIPTRIVGNLPYNISTPLLFHLIQYLEHIVDMHFMLQHEVVARMAAQPNTSEYGRLSIMLQYHCQVEYLFHVPPTAFKPVPKVDSAMVALKPHAVIQNPAHDLILFETIVRDAFNLRRKTLRNSLKKHVMASDWVKLNINPQSRAENLSVDDYVNIANFMTQRNFSIV
jgi:16S rRNA (adenine1518-N6/adenine1519-N6)-dimethyltransferase